MAYTRVYAQRISWENEPSINTPLNDVNLNKMDYALNQIDGTLATWDTTKADQSDLLLSVKTIDYDDETGVFIFTWQNGTTKTVDLNIEKIPVSFSMSPQGVITMTTEDGTTYTADVGALIKTYTFTDSSVIDFTVTTDASDNKTVTADIVDGSITGSKLQPNYLADCQAAQTGAETAQGLSEDSAEDSEAWAVGERGGVPVSSTDPTYENNAKYWAEHTSASLVGLNDVRVTNPQDKQALTYDAESGKWINGQAAGGTDAGDMLKTDYDPNSVVELAGGIPDYVASQAYTLPTAASNVLGGVKVGANLSIDASGVLSATDTNTDTLHDLTDVNISLPANGNILKYNSTSQKWENVSLSKSDVGLGNVDNTSDLDKPVSTATNTLVNNKHKVTSKAVDITGWTSDTTSQSGTTLYKKSISLSHVYVDSPSVDIGAASGSVLPTTAQQEAYDLLQYVTINGTTLTLYASEIPTTAFYINVEGVD